ncbi:aspartate--tRNA(Asn) ligase [Candidatus Pacearchaeota archaeon CG06_land_8_20_14_3_00_35_12]|nr:MAG: aspartate--tRNA(Asn) ligase [Candidatus Pacearchaeota archaeon CG06_land_8_20_14_3_00_35_12]
MKSGKEEKKEARERTYVSETKKAGEKVLLKGWIHDVRDIGKIKFLLLRDVTGIIQITAIMGKTDEKVLEKMSKIPRESVISIEGTVKESKQAPGGFEVFPEKIEVLSEADLNIPIPIVEKGNSETDLSKRLDWRWLDLRKPKNLLIFKIWTYMEEAMREWWAKNNFIQIYSPKFMGAPSESGAELFSVNYFGKVAYLAQSPQFYKQMAMASGFEKIFEIGPVFRANPSHTTRHDTEFTMIDMEISFVNSHEDVMRTEEEWIAFILSKISEKYGKEIKEVFNVDVEVPKLPFPRITMKEALKLLKEKGYNSKAGDLDAEGEKKICEIVKKKFNHDFIFITEYPYSVRPFYHMKKETDPGLTKSYDLIWKGLEITTGAQREHRYELLKKQAAEKKLNLKIINDYLNFFKYGCPPHGGFGLSPTRLLMILLNLGNVREATFLPRDTERLNP